MQEPPTTDPDPSEPDSATTDSVAAESVALGPMEPGLGSASPDDLAALVAATTAQSGGPAAPDARGRRIVAVAAVLALIGATALVVRLRAHDDIVAAPPPATITTTTIARPTTSTTRPPTTTTTMPPDPVPPKSTVTATLLASVQGYSAPNGAPTKMVENNYYKIPTKLDVIEQSDDGAWLHVRIPYKPNSSTAWIKKAGVVLDSTVWAIQIDVTRKHLRLYNAGELVVDAPVGVGTPYTPTPQGDFFVTFLQKPESSAYGPFVMITTGHSDVLQSFGGFPDGIMGIHGPIGSEYAIGDTGAAISNGCIRMKVADQVKLAQVTSGTPVHVYASPVPEAPPDPAADPGTGTDPAGSMPPGTVPAAPDTTGGSATSVPDPGVGPAASPA